MADKKITIHSFHDGKNSDLADQYLPNTQVRRFLNLRVTGLGTKGVAANIVGSTQIQSVLPIGENIVIGKATDEENSLFYYFVWNSNDYHTIYRYNDKTKAIVIVLQNLTDTNNVDILRWSDKKAYRIHHIDIVQNNLIYFVDALNKARKFNIDKAMDKTSAGYGLMITEDFITAYKQTAVYAPKPKYITDTTRASNNLYGNLFKFSQYWKYDDGELSNWSDWSVVAKPPNQAYVGLNQITFDNNCIELSVATGSQLVKKIVVAVKVNNTDAIDGTITSTNFVICAILDKAELGIKDDSTYIYKFYNDGAYSETSQDKINRVYSFMQRVPVCQSFVKSAMTYTGGKEGWEVVLVNMGVTIRYDDLYLPDDTVNETTTASLVVTEQSVTKEDPLFAGYRYNNVTRFVVGNQVKKGVTYQIFGKNGTDDNYYFAPIANGSDTAATIASQIKSLLRGIGRGDISNESTDGDGNVSFDYSYIGKWNASKTTWTSNVIQVSFETLKDNGVSLQLIPYGSVTNYGIVYIDDDGRESLAYTSSKAVIRTQYITELGDYKLPIHSISINHTPPIAAKYWRLVRTPQPHGLEIMIQKVIDVTTDNTSEYLDLVVGSLFTYQKLHQNTILKYEFLAGDRLRLIKNVDTGVLYGGFTETEVLSYFPETNELINESVTIHETDIIDIAGTATTDNIGKIVLINGDEREILAVTGGSNYRVNSPFVATASYVSYRLIDRRGTIRIKKPSGVEIVDNSLVELYHPQTNQVSLDYKIFSDFGQKYEISNYGTANRAHRGNIQDQTVSQPAIVEISIGDAYIRDRELPSNNVVPGTQVLISKVVDPNFSDFYQSDMTDLGRVYPQDDGKGIVDFGSRTRFSGNYIEDTGVNGLNDFDNLDRVDNNDSYGDIRLTRFFTNRLYAFKTLKDTYIPVSHTLTTDNTGNVLNVQSGKLLNQMQYFAWEGGIGNNPESWFYNGNFQYHASTNSGCFVRLGGEGVEPISTLYDFDKDARYILSLVDKYNLMLIGEYDRKYDEAIWSYPEYIEYLFNDGFNSGAWKLSSDLVSAGTTFEVTQQPATGTVTWDNTLKSFTVSDTVLGNDFYLYRIVLGGGSFGPVKKQCITTIVGPPRTTAWRVKADTVYCSQTSGENNGYQAYKILEEIYADDMSLTGRTMPNIAQTTNVATVSSPNTITFNTVDTVPTGGNDGDVWYNEPENTLYVKISGIWNQVLDRVTNSYYVPNTYNDVACPIIPPDPPEFYVTIYNQTAKNVGYYEDPSGIYIGQIGANNSLVVEEFVQIRVSSPYINIPVYVLQPNGDLLHTYYNSYTDKLTMGFPDTGGTIYIGDPLPPPA